MPMKIKSVEQLKRESGAGAEFFILLNHNLRSGKRIEWDKNEKKFFILNHIDDTEQELSEDQIMDKEHTNIGDAMLKGAFFKDD